MSNECQSSNAKNSTLSFDIWIWDFNVLMWNISKWLIIIGSVFIIVGAVGLVLQKMGLGKVVHHLPGDIRIQHGNFSFFLPITSCILISIILTIICSIVMRVRGH